MSKLSKSRHDFKSSVPSISLRRRSRLRSFCFEGLEERVVLSTITWQNRSSDFNWNTPGNWIGGVVPGAGDTAVINLGSGTVTVNSPGQSLSVGSIQTNGTTSLTIAAGTLTTGSITTNTNNSNFPTSVVTIAGGTLSITGASSFVGLSVTGGTLTDNAASTVNAATTWTGGTISGTGSIEAKAGLTLGFSTGSTASTLNLSGGASLINDATATVAANGAGTTLNVAGGSSITNKSTGTFDFQSSSSIVNNGGSPSGGTFVNQGTLKTSTANVSTTIGIPITNSNAIQASVGTLLIGAGGSFSSASNFSAASGAKIGFTSGTFSIPSGATFTGAGGLLVNGATITYGGGFSATGLVEIDSGEIDFNTATTLGSLLLAGGTLGGTGAVVVNGQATWTGGTLTGTGSTEAKAGLTLGYSSGSSLAQLALAGGRSLINDAAASGAANGHGFSLSVSGGSTITNKSGATFTFTSDSSIVNLGVASPGGTFVNQGTLSANGGTGTSSVGIPITNTGSISALTGTLNIGGGGTFSSASQLSASSGARIGFTSGTIAIPSGATFSGAGGILDNGATITFAGAYTATGQAEIDSGEIDFNTATTLGSLLLAGGTLGGTGAVVVNGQTTWSGGTINGAASIEAKGGLTLGSNTGTTTSQLSLTGGRSLINDATATTGSNGKGYSLAGDNTASITNASGASFAIGSSSTISNLLSIANAGTVTIGSGSSLALVSGYTQSAGTTTLNGGLTAGTTVAINGGSLTGIGTITGNVTNAAQILPGGAGAAGTLSITGNYTQTSTGTLVIDIGGTGSGTQYDVLAVSGAAVLAGALNVSSLNNYTPPPFTVFRPLTSSSTTADFSTYTFSGFGAALLYKNYDATGLYLHTVLPPTVPHVTPTINANGTSSFNLTASDLQTAGSSLVFTITALPSGTLYAGGTPVTLGETFTGSPLALTYLAPSVIFGNFTDSFSYSVSDSVGGVTSSTANLSLATPSPGVAAVIGAPGNDTIVVANSGGNLQVTINGVTTNTGIALSSITQLNVYGGSGDNSLEDSGLAINTTLNGGPGANTLIVAGDSGSDTFNLNNSTSVGFNGATITGTSPLTLLGGAGADTFNILGSNIGATINGGAGDDTFVLASNASLTTALVGGSGVNTINESAVITPVSLNVATSTVSGFSQPFANIQNVIGGTNAGNSLTGPTAGSTYNITGANAGNVGGIAFSGFGNIVAGSGNNRFVFNDAAALSGSLNAGAGANTIDESAYTTPVSLNVTSSTLTGVGTTFSGVQTFIGSATAGGTLTGPASTYNITGLNAGNVAGVTFSNYSNLVGGAGANLFKFSAAGSLAGGITGGSGSNRIDESAYTTPVSLNLATNTLTGLGSPYSNVQWITAGSGANTLTGPATGSTISITTANGGNISGFTFVGFGSLVGGPGDDTFRFTAGGSLSGSINGGGGNDTINQSVITTPETLNLATSTINRVGGTFSNISTILGGTSTANQVVGPDTATTFNITGYNVGNAAGVSFRSFRNIVGGAGNDIFKISNGVTLAGTLNGGGGTNTLDDSAYTTRTTTTVNLATNQVTGVAGAFSSIQMIIGGSNTGNTILGPNTGGVFNITSADAGNLAGIGFSGFGNLTGGTGNDTFVFSNGATISGRLNGGAGTNTVNLSVYTTPTSVNLATLRVTGVAGPFASIQSFVGGGNGLNKVLGSNAGNVFNITGANAGNLAGISFSRFGNLAGGTGNNSFVFSNGAAITGGIYGGTGTNTVNLSAYTTPTSVNLATSYFTGLGAVGQFSSIQSFIGGANSANFVTGPAAATTYNITALNRFNVNGVSFTGYRNIAGGAAENTYVLGNGAGLSGSLNGGGGGTNWLDYSAYTTGITVNLASGAATGFGGTISNISNVRGSASGADNLTGNSKGNILIGGGGTNTITGGTGASLLIAGTGLATINGGSGADLMIGGYSTLDNNNAALDAILAEWQSSDSYATKISAIKNGGGLNGSNTLNLGTTVVDNLAANVLTGATGGKNWYFKGTRSTVTDIQSGEQIN